MDMFDKCNGFRLNWYNILTGSMYVLPNYLNWKTKHSIFNNNKQILQQQPSSPNSKYPTESSTTFSLQFPFGSSLCFEILQWSACRNEFPLSAGTCCIFPSCWTEWNGSEPKRNRVASAEKWALGDMRERKYGNRFSSQFCAQIFVNVGSA